MLSLYLALWRLIALVNTQHWEMLDAGFQVVCCKVGTSISEQTNDLPQSRSRPIIVLPQTWRELQPDFLFLGVFCRNMFQLPCRPYFLALAEHTTESNDKKFSGSSTLKVHTDSLFTNLSFFCFRDLTKSWVDSHVDNLVFSGTQDSGADAEDPIMCRRCEKPGALANLPCEYVRKILCFVAKPNIM